MNRTIFCWPDTHVPSHDLAAVACVLDVVQAAQPDEVLLLGDLMDCNAPSRWSKASAEEYAGTLAGEVKATKLMLGEIRRVFDGRVTFIKGNHEDRIDDYLNRYAPAVKDLFPPLDELLQFEDYQVELMRQPYHVAPGVAAIHGNRLSSVLGAAGQSAFKERVRHGMSIVQGHSHRLGIGWDTQERSRFWMECGHLTDMSQMSYLDYSHANWTQGFGLIEVIDGVVFPSAHAIHDGASSITERAALIGSR